MGGQAPKFLANLDILCFERRCLKQNTVAHLKWNDLAHPTFWVGCATALEEDLQTTAREAISSGCKHICQE